MKYTAKSFTRWASLLSLIVIASAQAQTVHISHCMAGCPLDSSEMALDNNEIVVRQLFVASIDLDRGLADWQAYRVLAGSVGVASLLPRAWYEDNLVTRTAGQAETADEQLQFVQPVSSDAEERSYQLSEIVQVSGDQGRLVPMTSFAGTPYWEELNYLSNMAPLPYDLRVGSWSRLDQAINALADRIGEVYVVSGPIFGTQPVPDNEAIPKPDAYFKVVTAGDAIAAFVFENDLQQHASFCQQRSTLDAVQDATRLNLYPQRERDFDATLHEGLGCEQ